MGIDKKKDQTPQKKRGFKREGLKEKRFFIKIPQKNKGFNNKEFKTKSSKKETP
ncbi:hypothetical protein HPIN_06560 [Helicobacter pylori India7]|uniref:Uncharacterized protein n=1 Tax=Helicobacter pylori (strain India7) TaxID=907238 RepID=E8QHP3_HELP7|nr:hypothetical protein HPIN_06560 [Helicobacter pylori India7]